MQHWVAVSGWLYQQGKGLFTDSIPAQTHLIRVENIHSDSSLRPLEGYQIR